MAADNIRMVQCTRIFLEYSYDEERGVRGDAVADARFFPRAPPVFAAIIAQTDALTARVDQCTACVAARSRNEPRPFLTV